MTDLRTSIKDEMEKQGYTYDRLRRESGVSCDATSLNRKLNGGQVLTCRDGQLLARALGLKTPAIDKILALAESVGARVEWKAERRQVPS